MPVPSENLTQKSICTILGSIPSSYVQITCSVQKIPCSVEQGNSFKRPEIIGRIRPSEPHVPAEATLTNGRAAGDKDRAQAALEDFGSRSLPIRRNVELGSAQFS